MLRYIAVIIALLFAAEGQGQMAVPPAGQSGALKQAVASKPNESGVSKHGEQKVHQWLDEIRLSKEQKEKILNVRKAQRIDVQELRQERDALTEQLKLMMASSVPTSQVRELHGRLQLVQRKISDTYFDSMLSIRELLTPAQRQRFVEHMRVRGSVKFLPSESGTKKVD